MKCPSCNDEVMSFFQFYLWSSPFKTKCKSCGSKLRLDPRSRRTLYFEMISATILALLIQAFIRFTTPKGLVVFLLISIVGFYLFEKHSWENGNYELEL